jgi:hypothetical protein
MMIRTLSDLVGEAGAGPFLAHFVAKARWLGRMNDPDRTRSLLPWSEIDRLIAQDGIPREQIRVLLNKNSVERRLFRDEKSDRIRSGALQGLAAQGATLLINNISNLAPPIAELAANVERELGHRTHVNAYLSFGAQSAFLTHADGHDVIIVQVHGSKHWRCYGEHEPSPARGGHTTALNDVVWEDALHPGDVLYVPRGDVHAATPIQSPSVHLTIGVTENTGADFVKWLANKAVADEVFRRNLARNASPQERAGREAELKLALRRLIDTTPFDDYFVSEDHGRPLRVVAALDFPQRLRPESLLASALLRTLDLESGDPDAFKVEIGGERVRLGALARRALECLTAQPRTSFSDLAAKLDLAVDDAGLREALSDLARKALIEIADRP